MYITNENFNYRIIYGMLDLAITRMLENDICTDCKNHIEKDITMCNNEDLCRSCLFDGLAKKVFIEEQCNGRTK